MSRLFLHPTEHPFLDPAQHPSPDPTSRRFTDPVAHSFPDPAARRFPDPVERFYLDDCGEAVETFDCTVCRAEGVDPEITRRHEINGQDVCRDCVACCGWCGEWVDDSQKNERGPGVLVREWENDGRLSEAMHASCSAEWLLSLWCGEMVFDLEKSSREEVAAVVARAFPQGGAR